MALNPILNRAKYDELLNSASGSVPSVWCRAVHCPTRSGQIDARIERTSTGSRGHVPCITFEGSNGTSKDVTAPHDSLFLKFPFEMYCAADNVLGGRVIRHLWSEDTEVQIDGDTAVHCRILISRRINPFTGDPIPLVKRIQPYNGSLTSSEAAQVAEMKSRAESNLPIIPELRAGNGQLPTNPQIPRHQSHPPTSIGGQAIQFTPDPRFPIHSLSEVAPRFPIISTSHLAAVLASLGQQQQHRQPPPPQQQRRQPPSTTQQIQQPQPRQSPPRQQRLHQLRMQEQRRRQRQQEEYNEQAAAAPPPPL